METLNNIELKPTLVEGEKLGDKWYKFLVYFAIWFGAATNIILGILYLTGDVYFGAKDFIFVKYPALENTDFIYGLYRLIFGAFLIYTAWSMLKRKYEATSLLYGASIATILTGFTYSFITASNVVQSLELLDREGVTSVMTSFFSSYPIRTTVLPEFGFALYGVVLIGVSAVLLVINMLYFNKREDWFEKKKTVKIKKSK